MIMTAPRIDISTRGLEFPNIIGIGPIMNTPPVSILTSEPSLKVDKNVPEIIRTMPNKMAMNPIAINRSKYMIQSYLNSS